VNGNPPSAAATKSADAVPAPTLDELQPMLLGEAKRPFSDDAWAFEVKYDGYRALAEFGAAGVRLKSRRGTDMTAWFPELGIALGSIGGARCVVDGEICVLNEQGIAGDAEFNRLFVRQARRGYRPGDDAVTFCLFDALVVRGRSVMGRPLLERKRHLAKLTDGVPCTKVIDHWIGRGVELYQAAERMGLEGIIAKRIAAPYEPGVRSKDWLKIKRPGAVPAERFKH
jgi:bifunctional non-homologous end joining protein LigD